MKDCTSFSFAPDNQDRNIPAVGLHIPQIIFCTLFAGWLHCPI